MESMGSSKTYNPPSAPDPDECDPDDETSGRNKSRAVSV